MEKTASLNDIMIKHIRNIGIMNAILNKNSEGSKYTYAQIIKSMDEFASQEREWIDVNERLPEEEEATEFSAQVLTVVSGRDIYIQRYDYEFKDWTKVLYAGAKVTHWMELPKLPTL